MTQSRFNKIEKVSIILVFVFSVVGGLISGFINSEIKNYTGIENLKQFQPSIPTRIYDVNGELIAELFQEKRDLVSFEELPQSLINAFLAAEDQNFYDHFGIDVMAIVRAMGKNVIASIKSFRPTIVQGGSTITQQLAKRLFTAGERTIARKALEAVLAFQIEKFFSKEQILEMYFNQIYLGHGCHGISSAAQFFFNKDVKYLSVAESSVLAALPSKPNGYSPLKYPREAYIKHRDTLTRMVDAGFLDKAAADKTYEEFWPPFLESLRCEFPTKTALTKYEDQAPYFTDYVRQILLSRFGKDVVYNEGLSVYTTLDLKRQYSAQKYLMRGLAKQNEVSSKANAMYNMALDRNLFTAYSQLSMIFSLPGILVKNDDETTFKKLMVDDYIDSIDALTLLIDSPAFNDSLESFRVLTSGISTSMKVEGAILSIEPSTGYISTMVGGSEYNVSNQYNRAIQARRQPGSSFKPFVYGAGIEARKINAATVLPDAPIMDIDAQGEAWTPGNYEGDFSGMVQIRRALASSINIISVRIFDLVGAEKIIEYASRILKVPESRFNPNPSLALGVTELTPFEMAAGYAIYANRGRDVIPFAIRYVNDRDGNELANIEEEVGRIIALKEMNGTIQVVAEDVVYIMTSLMQDVVDRGTANEAIRSTAGFTKKAAGKTGTTSNWTDAWFCGFTPDLAAVVWIGYDKPFMSLGKHQAGAAVAAPIWGYYMKDIYNGLPDPVFPEKPATVTYCGVCEYTGMIPGPTCTKVIGDLMLSGSGPTKVCDGQHYKMKSVLDRYLETEGLKPED
ncbi:MAG: carboxypeptidase [Spirochaetae bacterium HGW-Spirochaetae-1]|jgi:penicillin-binding protein 1A|nr:MAG: carboxypeptidase [Spirochaetae bacterium HGW-Spirochaetae-1]